MNVCTLSLAFSRLWTLASSAASNIQTLVKADFSSLDASILQALAGRPSRLGDILQVRGVREHALRVARRRSGASPSQSADTAINERMQALRRVGRVLYDPATKRWEASPAATPAVPLPHLASTGFVPPAEGDLLRAPDRGHP